MVRVRRSYVIAGFLAAVATAWIISGQFSGARDQPSETTRMPEAATPETAAIPSVRVRHKRAEPIQRELVLRGRTAPARAVELKAETAGRVAAIQTDRGATVLTDAQLVLLADEDRPARLAQARATLKQYRIEHRAASKLQRKGFTAETRLAEANAELRRAKAELAAIELDIKRTRISAPFAGVLQERVVEVGDYLQIGDPIATVIEIDPILVVAPASERDVALVRAGHRGRLRLLDGEEVAGRVRYVSASGDETTRTFRVELEVPNPGGRIVANMTAELVLPLDDALAHRVSPAVVALDKKGKMGVKLVNGDGIVEFHAIDIISETSAGLWVSGLPEEIRLITVGQAFVLAGQRVETVLQNDTKRDPASQVGKR